MYYGVMMFPTDYAIRPDELAREAEDRGFESLFFPEHTHIPTSRRTPWPGGGELPQEYWHTHDPFVALSAAAAVTRRLKVGTGICLVIQRDTITLAKEVASLDFLSGGRFIFGIGGGWNVEEMANHGTEFRTRWRKLREQVAALKKIWTEDEPEFHGEFVNFDPIWSWPKPVQKPHPPILLGGHSQQVLRRVVDYCDGWLPLGVRGTAVIRQIEELRRIAEEKVRDPRTISISVYSVPADPKVIEAFQAAHVERVIFGLPPAGRDEVLAILDRYAKLIA
ncbi:MAG: LLM class F420-dependent oxidoreductase [Candidatus Binatia bacterium]|nr:MAG: LLM class F420-dependent oxidoreductase [Candidatus Binatia bacterium]